MNRFNLPFLHAFRYALLMLAALLGAQNLGAAEAKELESLIQSQAAAWNSADAEAWGNAYTEDSSFINILGMLFDGRSANQERHSDLFQTIFAGSQITISIEEVLYLSDDLAIADTILILTDFKRLPPGIPATADGQLQTRMKYIAQRTGEGGWKFIAAQNTAISPIAIRR